MGCKDIEIRKSEYVEKTQFLCLIIVNIFTDKRRKEESIPVVSVDELIQPAVIWQDTGKQFTLSFVNL